jgi:ATP-dependent DNA ligase
MLQMSECTDDVDLDDRRMSISFWLVSVKTPFNMTQEFVIGGYTPSHLGLDAIIVGIYRGKDLYFSSRVRAGFTAVTRRKVYQKIHKLETDRFLLSATRPSCDLR